MCVVERRNILGGAAVTEEIVPGFRFSRASYVYSLFRPQIVKDLDLHRHGLKLLPRVPSSFTPTPHAGGSSFLLGGGAEEDFLEISKLSTKDASAYPKYNALLERYSAVVRPLLDCAPPDVGALWPPSGGMRLWIDNMRDALYYGRKIGGLGADLPGFLELLTAPASKLLDRWCVLRSYSSLLCGLGCNDHNLPAAQV